MTALEQKMLSQIKGAGISEPESEYPTGFGKPRFDFAWPDIKLAIEVEGGTFIKGRHSRGTGYAKDAAKYNMAALNGWIVMRVTTDMIQSGDAIKFVLMAFKVRLNNG